LKHRILPLLLAVICVGSFIYACVDHAADADITDVISNAVDPSVPAAETHQTAKIMLAGDLMCLPGQQTAARVGNGYDFKSSFIYVKNIFAKSDFAIANLETALSESHPLSSQKKLQANGEPNCNGPVAYLEAIKYAGINALAMANNHTLDAGVKGIKETIGHVEDYGFMHTGSFASPDSDRYFIAEINGIKIGFLSYSTISNQAVRKEYEYAFKRYSLNSLVADIAKAKEAGAEYIIAYNHWGTENTHNVNPAQQKIAQEMADAGVDFIAGSHPHCLQRAVYITAGDGRKVFCIYSLGNFVSSMARDINNDTIILEADLKKTASGVSLEAVGYYPAHVFTLKRYNVDGDYPYVIFPASSAYQGGDAWHNPIAIFEAAQRIKAVMGEALPLYGGISGFPKYDSLPGTGPP